MDTRAAGPYCAVAPLGSTSSMHDDGYADTQFEGKDAQMAQVVELIAAKGFIPEGLAEAEVVWFYNNLGIDNMYFCMESAEVIAHHIMALYAAKMTAYLRATPSLDINLEEEGEDGAVYINSSRPGVSVLTGPQHEQRIDARYLNSSTPDAAYRVESYRSTGVVATDFATQLRCYFVARARFGDAPASAEDASDITKVSDRTFLSKASANTLEIYARVMAAVLARTGPVIEVHDGGDCGEGGVRTKRLVMGYRQGSTRNIFSATADLYHYYGLYSTSKYVESFANGVVVMCVYLAPLPGDGGDAPPLEHAMQQIVREASLLFCMPQSPLQPLFKAGTLSVQETVYGYAGLVFAQHFLNRLGAEYSTLVSLMDARQAAHVGVLDRIKKRLRQETFTREYVLDIVRQYPELVRVLFVHFAMRHYAPGEAVADARASRHGSTLSEVSIILRDGASPPHPSACVFSPSNGPIGASVANGCSNGGSNGGADGGPGTVNGGSNGNSPDASLLRPSLSYQRLHKDKALSPAEIRERIRRTVCNQHEQTVFEALLTFNEHVLKTNFYAPAKVALAFRLDPAFLPPLEYPARPFGMFLVLGSEFRGFHVRFRDVARGGVRIIRSRNREAYSINVRSLFDENYALASTQQRKNKDIPEGGAKGTILLDADAQGAALVAFQKYVDALLDLTVAGGPRVVDNYGRPEILFLGPDEGTADYMDWASAHARVRGAPFWKAFATGKSQALGGIPHDVFGMTTRSIHQYVLGIYAKLGVAEAQCRKLQTGGPDGDLGSNEIKISTDMTTAVVDGSGVVCDPDGLDRAELGALAAKRRMVANFDVARLGPRGYRVLIDERDVVLPDGTRVEDGLAFRNAFHLHFEHADLFVPCGGRPEAVDINSVAALIDAETGRPRYKWIVEGANLFFTQDARLRLEAAGAVIFKDASANKGGVTSSSLEVLAALAMTDAEFSQHMQVRAGAPVPLFYTAYVHEVHAIIEENARLEFECLWREHQRSAELAAAGKIDAARPLSVLSDDLSFAILRLDDELQVADVLWSNAALRELVLSDAIPRVLCEAVGGLRVLLARLPETYVRALFGKYLASRFVYAHGIAPSQFAFFEFMSSYYDRITQSSP